jgi:hypothetical protein
MSKKKKKSALVPEFVRPDGAQYVLDGQTVVGYVEWISGDQWRAFTADGKDLGLFADHRAAVKACPSAGQQ